MGQPSWPGIDTVKAIPWVEQKLGVTLAESQREAVKVAVSSKVMVITGGPGVGKTTLVNATGLRSTLSAGQCFKLDPQCYGATPQCYGLEFLQ